MSDRHFLIGALFLACSSAIVSVAAGQQPQAPAPQPLVLPPEAGELTAGWAALTAGRLDEASAVASTALARAPRSVAAAALLVQAETLRAGGAAGLAAYDRWVAARLVDDPYLLRIVARGVLRDAVHAGTGEAQRRAFRALYEEGDDPTLAAIRDTTKPTGIAEQQMLGALGNEAAVRALIVALRAQPGDRTRAINALAGTRSPLAAQAIAEVLSDPIATNRMAAADALGEMGATQAVSALRPLLKDEQFAPRFSAARALFRLGDRSGAQFLQDLQNSEHALVRAQALEATAAEPNGTWLSAVTVLLTDPDPMVRVIAARLMAAHDRAAAAAVAERLMQDENISIRQDATRTYAEFIVNDFAALRQYLRSQDAIVRVSAASRILELTR